MKAHICIVLVCCLSSLRLAAQAYGPIECDWDAINLVTQGVIVEEEGHVPPIWLEYRDAYRIRHICSGGWEIETSNGILKPLYIVYLRNSEASFYDACELAYNYFIKHKDKRKFKYDGFVVTTYLDKEGKAQH